MSARVCLPLKSLSRNWQGRSALEEVQEAVAWLARGDVRLVTPVKRGIMQGYELAHERLIPALRRVAGRELSLVDQANQLLDQRVNEWLGNNRARRYLLTWREVRLIQRQKPYVVWGTLKSQKEALLAQSRQRLHVYAGKASLVVLLISCFFGGWYSPWGQIWRVKLHIELLSHGMIKNDPTTLRQVAIALLKVENFEQARQVADETTDPRAKAGTLGDLAVATAQSGDTIKKASALLEQARQIAEGITDPEPKAQTLSFLAQAIVQSATGTKDLTLLEQARQIAEGITDPEPKVQTLGFLAVATAQSGDTIKASALLEQARQIAEEITVPRRLSEKEPVYQSIVAVGQMKGDNDSSLLSSLLSRRHTETNDERALQENVSALGAPALPAGGP